MISESSITAISHLFCGDIDGYYTYKTGAKLVSFLINILVQTMYTNLDFPPDGYMYIIKLLSCLIPTRLIISLILFLERNI